MAYTGTYHRLGVPIHANNLAVIRALWFKMLGRGGKTRMYRKGRHKLCEVLAAHKEAQTLARRFAL